MKVRLMHPSIGSMAFEIHRGQTLVLGRGGQSVDLELGWDTKISRRHAQLTYLVDGLWFEDLESRNRSWHGEHELRGPVRLEPKMVVLIGETALSVGPFESQSVDLEQETMETNLDVLPAPKPDTSPQKVPVPESTRDLIHVIDASLSGTSDKRAPATDPRPATAHVGFVTEREVELDLRATDKLRDAWTNELSKGGVFVPCLRPPPIGQAVSVRLVTQHGTIILNSKVVHVSDEKHAELTKGVSGVGLAFVDLDGSVRGALHAYVHGKRISLPRVESQTRDLPLNETQKCALEEAKAILRGADQADFYLALSVSPTSRKEQIGQRIGELKAMFGALESTNFPPAQRARVRAVEDCLQRARQTLLNPKARLEHDFRLGFINIEARMSEAQWNAEVGLDVLREVWNRCFPENAERAAALMRSAFLARQANDLQVAIERGRQALQLSPFFEELASTVTVWNQMNEERQEREERINRLRNKRS
jgi:Tfp pilus assembly protein PilZ/pSer/pThr/pTyr-binding forkhead associated (FHA) protein